MMLRVCLHFPSVPAEERISSGHGGLRCRIRGLHQVHPELSGVPQLLLLIEPRGRLGKQLLKVAAAAAAGRTETSVEAAAARVVALGAVGGVRRESKAVAGGGAGCDCCCCRYSSSGQMLQRSHA